MTDDKKTVVSEVKKARIPLPVFIRRKQKILGLLFILVILAGGATGYYFHKNKPNKIIKGPNGKEFQTITFEGREFKVPVGGFASHNHPPQTDTKSATEDSIKELEAKVAAGKAVYTDYHSLGQLYTTSGNTQKAIENYKIAIAKADSNMEHYQEFVDVTNQAIKYLEAN